MSLRPRTIVPLGVWTDSFSVTWQRPDGFSIFDKYQIYIDSKKINRRGLNSFSWQRLDGFSILDIDQVYMDSMKNTSREMQVIEKGYPLEAKFSKDLQPGRTYRVFVEVVSVNVGSWHIDLNITTRPLAVTNISLEVDRMTKRLNLVWSPDTESQQSSLKVIKLC